MQKAVIHAHISIQRYPIHTSHISRTKSVVCPCHTEEDKSLQHFIVNCPIFEPTRVKHVMPITEMLRRNKISTDDFTILQAIIDCTHLSDDSQVISLIISLARCLCFNPHLRRLSLTKGNDAKLSACPIKKRPNILTYREPSHLAASHGWQYSHKMTDFIRIWPSVTEIWNFISPRQNCNIFSRVSQTKRHI